MSMMQKIESARTPEDAAAAVKGAFGELNARLFEVEQKGARGGSTEHYSRTPGEEFVDSTQFKGLMENLHAGRRVGIELKSPIQKFLKRSNILRFVG